MAEGQQPATLEALMAAMTNLTNQMATFQNRLENIEQRNQNVAPIGPRRVVPQVPREHAEPEGGEEPPGMMPPQAPDPIQVAENILRRNHADRNRFREDDRNLPPEVKLTAPTFAGKIDPSAYLEWERRMEHLFEYYSYTEPKKIALATASLTAHALAWWDREVAEKRRLRYPQITRWTDMKLELRRRYVPPHFHRDLLRKFRGLYQGTRSVEEYYEEFDLLRSQLEMEETEESLMSQFVDGLQNRIQRKVEVQPYHSLQEVLHLAIQFEQHIKKKATSRSRPNNTISQPQQPMPPPDDKGKAVVIDNRYKSHDHRVDQGKPTNPQRSHELICYKCQGRGHMARDCPNKRVMVITPDGYDSQDEVEPMHSDEEPIILYPEVGELLVLQRVLSAQQNLEEPQQRDNLFHSKCTIKDKVCHLIVDSGSCTNIASTTLVEKLGLTTSKHPRPYTLKWLNDSEEIKVARQVEVAFSIGSYQDRIVCDVAPMQAGHMLLGRPWQYDRDVTHNGRTNEYSFTMDKKKFTLAPMKQAEVRALQARAKVSANTKVSFYIDKTTLEDQNLDIMHLSWPKEIISGCGAKAEFMTRRGLMIDTTNHTPTLELKAAKGVQHLLFEHATPYAPSRPTQKIYQGKALASQRRMKADLLSLGVGLQVSRSKLFQGGGDDADLKAGQQAHLEENGHTKHNLDQDSTWNASTQPQGPNQELNKPPDFFHTSTIRPEGRLYHEQPNKEGFDSEESSLTRKKTSNNPQVAILLQTSRIKETTWTRPPNQSRLNSMLSLEPHLKTTRHLELTKTAGDAEFRESLKKGKLSFFRRFISLSPFKANPCFDPGPSPRQIKGNK